MQRGGERRGAGRSQACESGASKVRSERSGYKMHKQVGLFYIIRQLVVILLGTQLLFISAFTALSVPVATPSNLSYYLHNLELKIVHHLPLSLKQYTEQWINPELPAVKVHYMYYVPEIPAAILIGCVLGIPGAIASICLFLLEGLIGPIFRIYPFAEGGGWAYFRQPGFGYLLGLLPASALSAWLTTQGRTSFRQLSAVLGGVLLVHLCGLVWMLTSCFVSVLPFGRQASLVLDWHPWLLEEVYNLSLCPLFWDFLFSLVVVGLSFPLRWLINTLTTEDVSVQDEALLANN